jgi:hypothetical protein
MLMLVLPAVVDRLVMLMTEARMKLSGLRVQLKAPISRLQRFSLGAIDVVVLAPNAKLW